jgi:hypothetical protein
LNTNVWVEDFFQFIISLHFHYSSSYKFHKLLLFQWCQGYEASDIRGALLKIMNFYSDTFMKDTNLSQVCKKNSLFQWVLLADLWQICIFHESICIKIHDFEKCSTDVTCFITLTPLKEDVTIFFWDRMGQMKLVCDIGCWTYLL